MPIGADWCWLMLMIKFSKIYSRHVSRVHILSCCRINDVHGKAEMWMCTFECRCRRINWSAGKADDHVFKLLLRAQLAEVPTDGQWRIVEFIHNFFVFFPGFFLVILENSYGVKLRLLAQLGEVLTDGRQWRREFVAHSSEKSEFDRKLNLVKAEFAADLWNPEFGYMHIRERFIEKKKKKQTNVCFR